MPWDEEGTDYDEPKSGGDSHEDEFDEEYGEQQPKGDPGRPDNALEDAYQADIDYWEAMARLNAIARPFESGGAFASDAAALNPVARPFDPDESFSSDAAAVNPYAGALEDSSEVSLSSQLSSLDPDDFERSESVDHVGPPIPDSAAGQPDATSSQSFDPAVQFTDPFGDTSLSLSSPPSSPPDHFEPDDTYQIDSAAREPSFDPAVEFQPDISERTDSTEFMG
jgi:hypothetical protein